jgi:uncharacterized RDD family membrane protein YckC
MEIWLIQNGKKVGPINDYEIRNRISNLQLEADDYAWYEGLPSWVKLQDMDLFKNEFEPNKDIQPPPLPAYLAVGDLRSVSAQSKKENKHLARRFWARWLDLTVYMAVWWLLMYMAELDIGEIIINPWLPLSLFIPWFAIEAWLLYQFGTTLGKWLLGIRVVNEDGTALTLKASIRRSVLVWIAGFGFGWGLLTVLCHAMSWFTVRSIGKPVWDYMGQHKITVAPLKAYRIIVLILLFFTATHLQMAVRGPHDQEIFLKAYPEFKEFFERGKPWHLPVKR